MTDKTPEREALEKRAAELDVTFAANIGDEKLAERIKEAEAKLAPAISDAQIKDASVKDLTQASETKPKTKGKAKAEAGSITVIGPKAGFWRAGIRFGAEPQTFEPGELTAAQIKAIKNEPKLAVTTTE